MKGKRIPELKKYQGRNPEGYFEDLSWEVKRRAHGWLWLFCKRWGYDLPQWRFAILVGQAKRLALNPPDSAWGRSMAGRRGGLAVQIMYRREGRNPTEAATQVRLLKQRARERHKQGLPLVRYRYLPLD